jgi:hypothetical protein
MGSRRTGRSSWILTLALLAAGCTSYVHYPHRGPATTEPDRVVPVIEYERQPISHRNSILEDDPRLTYQIRHIEMDSIGENGQEGNRIEAVFYRTNHSGKRPLVIILPIWGGSTYPPRKFVKALRSRSGGDVHVLNVLGEDYVFDWEALAAADTEEEFLALMERMMLRDAVHAVDVSRLIDWAEARPEVDASRIGLIASRTCATS